MSINNVKKELKKLDKDKLIDLVVDLYRKNKSVKEFFDYYVNPNERELFNKYRDRIFEAFYPKRGFKYSLKNGKQAISDFKKIGSSPELLADLMLFYVETGVRFINDFGDIDEGFYSSLETTYVAALKLMSKEDLLDKFAERAGKVVRDTNNIGWGFHDYVADVYFNFFDDFTDDEDDEQKEPQHTAKIFKLGEQ